MRPTRLKGNASLIFICLNIAGIVMELFHWIKETAICATEE